MRTILVRRDHDNGQHCQVVLKQVDAKVLVLDTDPDNLQSLKVRSKVSDISDYRQAGVPHRLTFRRAPSGELSMKIEISHAITDGASLMVLLRDLRLQYDGRMQNVSPAASFSQHTAQLQGRLEQDSAYWEKYCGGALPCYLPQIPRADDLGTNVDFVVRYVNIDLKHAGMLSAFCQRQSISVSNLFCAIWSLVLKHHTSSNPEDIIFGYLVSGREAAEETAGPLFSALISRIQLSGDTTVKRLLETVRDDFAESSAHQVCDMQHIEHGLGIDMPLFNTMVNFRKFPAPDVEEEPSLRFDVVEGVDPFDYDMMLLVKETKDSWKINLAYWSAKVDSSLAQTIAKDFDLILSSAL
ncbi:hypothetical protein HYALB_00005332 [Hymenoscyphus albidus]|uniref:Condensation domain-containing protein n=1 Tax=Hymenoscyphus albidus TaxID=595503 RepID=A0A9N9M0B6_9HELO|nr:hypothetical protein HYALB_00005332 [Hymenoscyphus albidus]